MDRSTTGSPTRWPWSLSAILLIMSAGAAAVSTWLHWLPCRGSMLVGSILSGYRYSEPGFSDACLRRMDAATPFPWPTELAERDPLAFTYGLLAMILAGLAWAPVILGLRWSLRTKIIAALPLLVSMITTYAAHRAAQDPNRPDDSYLPSWAWFAVEAAGLAVVIAAVVSERPGGLDRVRLVLLAWGATAFGLVHGIGEFTLAITLSDANWDIPPGTGYGTSVTLVGCAIAILIATNWRRRPEDQAASSMAKAAVSASR